MMAEPAPGWGNVAIIVLLGLAALWAMRGRP
jgi:MYXO-CTERM domain-containing protein